jgi:hypothetical protein
VRSVKQWLDTGSLGVFSAPSTVSYELGSGLNVTEACRKQVRKFQAQVRSAFQTSPMSVAQSELRGPVRSPRSALWRGYFEFPQAHSPTSWNSKHNIVLCRLI